MSVISGWFVTALGGYVIALGVTLLNETKTMVLQGRNLLKSQRYFLEQRVGNGA